MHRFYADTERSSGIYLTPSDAHHAVNVLRLREGSQVEIIHNEKRFLSRIVSINGNDIILSEETELPSTEPDISCTLFQGIPKGDKMEWIVQKAVELGVSAIVPLMMSRCVVRLDEHDRIRKQQRWQKIAREACKQSGRCRIPTVSLPVRPADLFHMDDLPEHIVIPWEESSSYGPRSYVKDYPHVCSLGIVIGPEGGIDPEEIRLLATLPARIITLGRRILRTETAGIAAVSALMALYGEME